MAQLLLKKDLRLEKGALLYYQLYYSRLVSGIHQEYHVCHLQHLEDQRVI